MIHDMTTNLLFPDCATSHPDLAECVLMIGSTNATSIFQRVVI
jgi:hypothetical protein